MSSGQPTVTGTTDDGSAAAAAATGTPVVGSTASASEQEELQRLRDENAEIQRVNRQLLSEKTTTEEMRRQAQAVLEGAREDEQGLAQLAQDLQSNDLEVRTGAQQWLIRHQGQQLNALQGQVNRLSETVQATILPGDDSLPREIREKARDRFNAGNAKSLQEALAAEVGAAVMAGTYRPGQQPQPKPAPVTPQPVVQQPNAPTPLATQMRSVASVPAANEWPETMTIEDYLALPDAKKAEAYQLRKSNKLKVPGLAPV